MIHRIAAGVIIEDAGRILLVRHYKPGRYDFWVTPGGGAEGNEDLRATAIREAKEESGLDVETSAIAYIEELTTPTTRECKVWFIGRVVGGELHTTSAEAAEECITEAAFLAPSEFAGKRVYPPVLHDEYWRDKDRGFAQPRYLGVRAMLDV
jgi:ADP-ribose pyrophosphatase YjhB (NUDIX family)